jgi:antitoxin CcdA
MTDHDDAAIAQAKKEDRNRQWWKENAARLEDYAREVAQEGLPLAQYRSF